MAKFIRLPVTSAETDMDKFDVFISYARLDYVDEKTGTPFPGNPVSAIMEALDRAEISYWIDKKGIYSSERFDEVIPPAIRAARCFVYVSSERANASWATTSEVRVAHDHHKKIFPVKIDQAPYSEAVDFRIGNIEWLEYYRNPEGALDKLVASIRKVMEEDRKKEVVDDAVAKLRRLAHEEETEILRVIDTIGTTEKKCPVCQAPSSLEEKWCPVCGFGFPPVYGMPHREGKADRALDRNRVDKAKEIWTKAQTSEEKTAGGSRSEVASLKKKNKELTELNFDLSRELAELKEEKAHLEAENKAMKSRLGEGTVSIGTETEETIQLSVDLGLSVKWATCNVGAARPEERGGFFSWGEVEEKATNKKSVYRYLLKEALSAFVPGATLLTMAKAIRAIREDGSEEQMLLSKYNTKPSYGKVDKLTRLEAVDDAATQCLGENWRMPTDAEWKELIEKCSWEWTEINGVSGYRVTSDINGESIFLPAAGRRVDKDTEEQGTRGYYWSSSLDKGVPDQARHIYFDAADVRASSSRRYTGQSVRAVTD